MKELTIRYEGNDKMGCQGIQHGEFHKGRLHMIQKQSPKHNRYETIHILPFIPTCYGSEAILGDLLSHV